MIRTHRSYPQTQQRGWRLTRPQQLAWRQARPPLRLALRLARARISDQQPSRPRHIHNIRARLAGLAARGIELQNRAAPHELTRIMHAGAHPPSRRDTQSPANLLGITDSGPREAWDSALGPIPMLDTPRACTGRRHALEPPEMAVTRKQPAAGRTEVGRGNDMSGAHMRPEDILACPHSVSTRYRSYTTDE